MSDRNKTFPISGTNIQTILNNLKKILNYKDLKKNDVFKMNFKNKEVIYEDVKVSFDELGIKHWADSTRNLRLNIWSLFDLIEYTKYNNYYAFLVKDLTILNDKHLLKKEWFKKNEKLLLNKDYKYSNHFASLLLSIFLEKYVNEKEYKKRFLLSFFKEHYSLTKDDLFTRKESLFNEWKNFQERLSKGARRYLLDLFKLNYLQDEKARFLWIMDELWLDLTNEVNITYNQKGLNVKEMKTLNDLSKINDTISIPQFQREYVWKKWITKNLVEDILKLLLNEKDELFLGTLIFTRGENSYDSTLSLVDGQQRFLTLLMVLRVLYHFSKKNKTKTPKKWLYFLKSIVERVEGMDYVKNFLKLISLNEVDEFNVSKVSKQTREALIEIYTTFKEVHDKKILFFNNKSTNPFSVLGKKIKIYGFLYEGITHIQNSISIFVTQNVSSQIVDSYTLIRAYLMTKVEDVNYEKLDKISELMDKYSDFHKSLNDKVFLKHFYYYLSIQKNRIEQFKIEDNDFNISLENYRFFKQYICPTFFATKTYHCTLDKIMDFINIMIKFHLTYYDLKKCKNYDIRKKRENWKSIYDLLLCLRQVKPMFPIIICLLHHYEDALKQYDKMDLTNLRWLLWSLLKLYLKIYSYGDTLGNIIIEYKEAFREDLFDTPKAFSETLKNIVNKKNQYFDQRLRENLTSGEKKDLKIIIHSIIEFYIRSYIDNSSVKVNEAFYTPIEGGEREKFLNFLWGKNKLELEHIIPQEKSKIETNLGSDSSYEEFTNIFKKYYNCIGNTTLLHHSINNSLKNKPYIKKIEEFKDELQKGNKNILRINEKVKSIKIGSSIHNIIGPFNMGLWVKHNKNKDESAPNQKNLKQRHEQLINFIIDIIEK